MAILIENCNTLLTQNMTMGHGPRIFNLAKEVLEKTESLNIHLANGGWDHRIFLLATREGYFGVAKTKGYKKEGHTEPSDVFFKLTAGEVLIYNRGVAKLDNRFKMHINNYANLPKAERQAVFQRAWSNLLDIQAISNIK